MILALTVLMATGDTCTAVELIQMVLSLVLERSKCL